MKKKFFRLVLAVLIAAIPLCSCSESDTESEESFDGYEESVAVANGALVQDQSYDYESEASAYEDISASGISTYSSYNYSTADRAFKAEAETADEEFSLEAPNEQATGENAGKSVSGRKIIYSSNYDIETEEFKKSLDMLDELCAKYGAYYETSNTYGYGDGAKRAKYTVRVPVENYTLFIGEAESLGTVISSSQNNTDVTERYFDTEARLESAKLREERVLEILSKAEKLDDVLTLERELSDIRYEIESYTGSLRKYDSLVSFATVKIEITELLPEKEPEPEIEPKPEPEPEPTFGERVKESFGNGVEEFKARFENFVVFLSYRAIALLIMLVIIIVTVIVVVIIIKKFKKELSKLDNPDKKSLKTEKSKETETKENSDSEEKK